VLRIRKLKNKIYFLEKALIMLFPLNLNPIVDKYYLINLDRVINKKIKNQIKKNSKQIQLNNYTKKELKLWGKQY
jgi:hypothetical protein